MELLVGRLMNRCTQGAVKADFDKIQKGGIENVHTMLRMILPKGTVFENFTQWDIRKAVDHVNNAPRRKLDGRTPYELAIKTLGV